MLKVIFLSLILTLLIENFTVPENIHTEYNKLQSFIKTHIFHLSDEVRKMKLFYKENF